VRAVVVVASVANSGDVGRLIVGPLSDHTAADQPKLEEDGVEIVGFVPRTPASTRPPPQSSRPPQQGGGGLTSPYFASSTSSGNKS
jgi:hypothetical protein